MTTINISLPKSMYQDVKRTMIVRRYSSTSELVRDALRKLIYGEITENGFTPEFEELVLKAESEPMENDQVWETEEDIENYFKNFDNKVRNNGKNKKGRKLRQTFRSSVFK